MLMNVGEKNCDSCVVNTVWWISVGAIFLLLYFVEIILFFIAVYFKVDK